MVTRNILLAKIGAPHGIKGEVRVTPFGDPEMLDQYGKLTSPDGQKFKIKRMRPQKNIMVVKFEGINCREEAEAVAGTQLYVDRSVLPEIEEDDEFYLSDLIGLEVHNIGRELIGNIKDVPNFGADDMLEIQPKEPDSGFGGQTYFLPFTKTVVPEINFEDGFVVVDPPAEVSERDGENSEEGEID